MFLFLSFSSVVSFFSAQLRIQLQSFPNIRFWFLLIQIAWKKESRQRLRSLRHNILFAEKENLCLYGLPNETWEVNLPAEEVPPELPEPALGINFARDGMEEKDWLSLVAVHSDAWLLAVAFYFGARFGFDKESRYCTYY